MKTFFKIVFKALFSTALLSLLLGSVAVAYMATQVPSVSALKEVRLQVPLKIFSRDRKLIAEFGDKRRIPIKLEQAPQSLINAFVATEDRRFFEHQGVDLRGLGRAAVSLFRQRTLAQGGSTITMQVARNFFLSRKKSFIRKINEVLLAFKIEQTLTKQEILELYLNKIYLGKQAYGVAAAAEVYYGITVDKLTLAQMAMIAGLPQAPSIVNPLNSPEAALKRRKHVLDRMLEENYITLQQHDSAQAEPLGAQYHKRFIEIEAPYVAEMARLQVVGQFGEDAYALGYEVYTTIDSQQQEAANLALRRALLEYDQRHGFRSPSTRLTLSRYLTPQQELESWQAQLRDLPNYGPLRPAVVAAQDSERVGLLVQGGLYIEVPVSQLPWNRNRKPGSTAAVKQAHELLSLGTVIYVQMVDGQGWQLTQIPEAEAALVALSPANGDILALVGGFDYHRSSFNRAAQAERQAGSNFKPFIYAASLAEGATLATVLNDAPLVQDQTLGEYEWRPQNDNRTFGGPTRLRVALTQSRNLVSIRLLQLLGSEKAIDYAERFGFDRNKLPQGLSLALGSNSVTPLALARAYASFANGGFQVTPQLIWQIKDDQGRVLFDRPPIVTQDLPRAISPQVAFLMRSTLQDAIQNGTGRRAASLERPDLAGKTGTTNDKRDAWYSGFNSDIVATAWVGFDEPRSLKEYGAQAALPLWIYFMEAALKGKPIKMPSPPPDIISVRIDPSSGLLARPGQKDAIYEQFIVGTEPKQMASETAANTAADPMGLNSNEEEDSLF